MLALFGESFIWEYYCIMVDVFGVIFSFKFWFLYWGFLFVYFISNISYCLLIILVNIFLTF